MEEFETYFEKMNFHFSSWSDILENENIDIISNGEIPEQNVQLLPRQDVPLYGIIPKMEKKVFSSCKECKHIFNPRDVLLHKNCSFKIKTQHVSHFKKKVKTKKKSPLPLPPLFPTGLEGVSPLEELNTTELHPNSIYIVNVNELPPIDADASPILAKTSPLMENVGDIPLPSILSPHMPLDESSSTDMDAINFLEKISSKSHTNSNFHSGFKNKKKKYSKSREPDSNTHCGLVLDPKGPCTRSVEYSNHSSENDDFHRQQNCLNSDSDYFSQNSQEMTESDPVIYMPMSPVSALSPLQIIEERELCFDPTEECLKPPEFSHKIFFTIPDQLSIKMYKTRPKLSSIPLYGARNIGGAIVISKQKLVNQRKDILSAISRKPKSNDLISDGNKDQQNCNHDVQLSLMNLK